MPKIYASARSRCRTMDIQAGYYRESVARLAMDAKVSPQVKQDCVLHLELIDTYRRQLATFLAQLPGDVVPLEIGGEG